MIRHALLAAALFAGPVAAATGQDAAVTQVVDAFAAAQRDFDPAALARLTAPDYVEISPLGEVDPRDAMLGFYAADKKTAPPPVTIDQRTVRVTGDMALATQRYAIGTHAMRVVYVARRDKGAWKLVSAQYTPIRAPRPS